MPISEFNSYCVGPSHGHLNWTRSLRLDRMSAAHFVMFTGGTDINPVIYGKLPNRANETPDRLRDAEEIEAFEKAIAMKIPMIGICRGAQLLCALAGGILVQHQNHPSNHYIHTSDGRQLRTTSCHHQRAYPYAVPHKLIAWADNLSSINEGEPGEDLSGEKEAEIVYYPEIKALGIQGHPEWCYPSSSIEQMEFIRYCQMLLSLLVKGHL